MSAPTPPTPLTLADVVVVGAGAVGVSIAYELARRGVSVAVLERGADVAWGCSAGNAGIVGPSHVLPLAGPDALRDGLRWLRRPDSPFAIRPRPGVVPWLTRFAVASVPRNVDRTHRVLRPLALQSAQMHADLAAAGLETGYRRNGLLNVYAGERAWADALRAAEEDRADGLRVRAFDADAVADHWPQLTGRPAGALLYEDDAHCDPAAYVRAVADAARAHGAKIVTGVEVLALRHGPGGVRSLTTTAGEVRAGQVVLAAGVWSPELMAGVPLRLPIEGGKGYHVELEGAAGDPELPIWLQEDRVVVTPLDRRLRVAGTLELAGVDERIDERRLHAVLGAAREGLAGVDGRRVKHVWRGLRPCTPDGLPAIGRVPGAANLVVAAGHGMWGLQLAPVTGRLVAGIVTGEQAGETVLAALRPDRFGAPLTRRAAA